MNTMSMTPCALQRLMAAVWLKKSLKPIVIPGASFGCSSGFQLWISWTSPGLECGLPSPVVRPSAGPGRPGLPSNTSCPGSLIALHVSSPLFLLCAVCVSLALSTQLTEGSWDQGTPSFPGVSASKARWCRGVKPSRCRQGEEYQAHYLCGDSPQVYWVGNSALAQ